MRYDQYPETIFRPIGWATAVILLGSLLFLPVLDLTDWQRFLLASLIGLFAAFSFVLLRYVMPRAWHQGWIFYFSTLAHVATIAVADLIIGGSVDLSPLYAIVIIIVAVIADRRTALFAAALASGLQITTAWFEGNALGLGAGGLLRIGVFFIAAVIVSQLASALIERWRVAATQAERQRIEIEQRKNELEGLHAISQAFENLDDARATLRQVAKRIAELLNAEICVLARFDETRSLLLGMPPGYGLSDEQIRTVALPVNATLDQLWDVNAREYFFLNDLRNLPAPLSGYAEQFQMRQIVAARMVRRGRATGVIFVANKIGGGFTEADAGLLHILAGQAAIAIENAELYHEAQGTLREVAQLYAISTELVKQSDPNEIPPRVVNLVAQALNAPIATIALLNSHGTLEFAGAIGVPANALHAPFRPHGMGMTVAQSGVPRFIEDILLAENISPVSQQWGFRAVACLPIRYGAKVLGVLYVNYADPHTFSEIEKNILHTFANQIAVALENARLYDQLQEQARRDSLTQVYNHGYFVERLSAEVARAQADHHALSLIMLDIDYFKKYNDQYGHVVGDQVLQVIVQTVRAHVEHTDLIGRWGGEEFCIALLATDTPGATLVAERIRQTIKETKLPLPDHRWIDAPTVSQGIATFPAHAGDTSALIDLADAALYRAKARGRDQVCVGNAEC